MKIDCNNIYLLLLTYNENNFKGYLTDIQASSVALREKQQTGKIDLWSQRSSLTFFVRLSEVVPSEVAIMLTLGLSLSS